VCESGCDGGVVFFSSDQPVLRPMIEGAGSMCGRQECADHNH
jgi:hypothetical protein